MVTSVTSFSRTGLSDWLIQRVTSLVLLAYFLLIANQLTGSVDYTSWRALFDQTWMKVFTLMAALSLVAHAWIGLWMHDFVGGGSCSPFHLLAVVDRSDLATLVRLRA